jgi:hypothetical protein
MLWIRNTGYYIISGFFLFLLASFSPQHPFIFQLASADGRSDGGFCMETHDDCPVPSGGGGGVRKIYLLHKYRSSRTFF